MLVDFCPGASVRTRKCWSEGSSRDNFEDLIGRPGTSVTSVNESTLQFSISRRRADPTGEAARAAQYGQVKPPGGRTYVRLQGCDLRLCRLLREIRENALLRPRPTPIMRAATTSPTVRSQSTRRLAAWSSRWLVPRGSGDGLALRAGFPFGSGKHCLGHDHPTILSLTRYGGWVKET